MQKIGLIANLAILLAAVGSINCDPFGDDLPIDLALFRGYGSGTKLPILDLIGLQLGDAEGDDKIKYAALVRKAVIENWRPTRIAAELVKCKCVHSRFRTSV